MKRVLKATHTPSQTHLPRPNTTTILEVFFIFISSVQRSIHCWQAYYGQQASKRVAHLFSSSYLALSPSLVLISIFYQVLTLAIYYYYYYLLQLFCTINKKWLAICEWQSGHLSLRPLHKGQKRAFLVCTIDYWLIYLHFPINNCPQLSLSHHDTSPSGQSERLPFNRSNAIKDLCLIQRYIDNLSIDRAVVMWRISSWHLPLPSK